jgi:membrane peptidoglycan carboxypeptidase
MTEMLADVIDHGTAYKARQLGFRLPAAGKTGTTNEYRDAWFVGYTPHLVTGVWVGFDQPQTIFRDGYAGEVAVPLWARFMREATKGDEDDWYKTPQGIVTANVCRLSGKRPASGCYGSYVQTSDGSYTVTSSVYTEYFKRGSVPEETCPLHTYRPSFETRTASWEGSPDVVAPASPTTPATLGTGRGQATAQAAAQNENAEGRPEVKEPEKKKRGFWARVFGIGKDKDKDKDKDDEKKKEPRQ